MVAVTPIIVIGVFNAVHEHAAEASFVQFPDALPGGGSVLTGAKMSVERGANGGERNLLKTLGLHELRSHEPRAKVHHGLNGSGMKHGGGSEELGGGYGGEEFLNVVEIELSGVGGGGEEGGCGGGRWFGSGVDETRRRRESGGERRRVWRG